MGAIKTILYLRKFYKNMHENTMFFNNLGGLSNEQWVKYTIVELWNKK